MSAAAALDDALVRATTDEVLRRAEFHNLSDTPWFIEILSRAREWLLGFGRWANDHPAQGWVVVCILVLVLMALLAHLLYVALGDALPWGGRNRPARSSQFAWTVLEGAASSWRAGLERAQAALAAGDPRLAVWIAHRVLLGLLDEAGAIRFAAGKTNTDYLGECAESHPWREVLARLTGAYERIVYGHRDARLEPLSRLLDEVQACLAGGRS